MRFFTRVSVSISKDVLTLCYYFSLHDLLLQFAHVVQYNLFHFLGLLFVDLALVLEHFDLHLGLLPHYLVLLRLLVQLPDLALPLLHLAQLLQQILILLFQVGIFLFCDLRYALVPRHGLSVHCTVITGTNAIASLAVYFASVSVWPSRRNREFSFFALPETDQQVICVSSTAGG